MYCKLTFYFSLSSTCKTLCVIKGGKDGCRGSGGHLKTKIYAIFVLKNTENWKAQGKCMEFYHNMSMATLKKDVQEKFFSWLLKTFHTKPRKYMLGTNTFLGVLLQKLLLSRF